MTEGLCFNDLACGNAACANVDPLDCAFEIDLDFLKVRKKAAESLTDNFRTGTTGPLDLSASFIFIARDRALLANCASFWHMLTFTLCLTNSLRSCRETTFY